MLLFDTRALLVGAFNQRRGTNHAVADVEFGIPFSISELPTETATIDNTCIRLRAGGFEETFTYRRLGVLEPMQQFTHTTSPLKLRSKGSFTESIAASFASHYGYPMHPDDILEDGTAISGNVLILKISNRSVQWMPGHYGITLDGEYVRIGKHIARVITPARVEPEWWYEDRVDWLKLPDNTPRADVLTYGTDYTPVREYFTLLSQPVWGSGYVHANLGLLQDIASALRTVDGLPWSADAGATTLASGKYNLINLWCPYNGPIDNCKQGNANLTRVPAEQLRVLTPANPAFTHVCLLRAESASTVIGTKGFSPNTMLLHYNA